MQIGLHSPTLYGRLLCIKLPTIEKLRLEGGAFLQVAINEPNLPKYDKCHPI